MSNREGVCVGGPLDGKVLKSRADIIQYAEAPNMAYHWTRDHRQPLPDPMWFEKGLPEPKPWPKVWEWHEYGWESPEVLAIRDAVAEATERVFGGAGATGEPPHE